jgi:ABC-2 type transport system permease protein
MIRHIVRKEMREMWRDSRFRWASGILFVLLSASVVVGWRHYAEAHALHQKAQAEERSRWLNKGEMDPHPAMHFGFYAYQPQLSLSAVDDGIAPYVGSYTLLEAHQQTLFQDKPAESEAPIRRVSEITAATCLQMLAPLLIALLGFSSFVGEREQGTLHHLLSLGVSKKDLVIGKALGIGAPLAVVLIPIAIIGSLGILLNSSGVRVDTAERLFFMSLAYALYFLTFLAVTLSVSIAARSSRQALLALLLFWFTTCLMAPPVLLELAGRLYPTPPGFQFVADIAKEKRERFFIHYAEREIEIERELLLKYNVTSKADLPVNPEGLLLLEEQQINDDIYNKAFHRLFSSYRKQTLCYQVGGLFSPMIAAQSLSLGLAGTDIAAQEHFSEAARRYRSVMETTLNEDQAYNLTPGQRGRELWEKIPPFRYTPPTARWALNNYLASVVILIVWLLAALLALRLATIRLEA